MTRNWLWDVLWRSSRSFAKKRRAIPSALRVRPFVEVLEDRLVLTTLTTLYTFSQFPNGANPQSTLVRDSAGDLFGTTSQGSQSGDGTVFVLAPGSLAPTTLASFNGTNGDQPSAGVIEDAQGDLFGTTSSGSASHGGGTVFELASAAEPTASRHSFPWAMVEARDPSASVIEDANGNLFGTTVSGGAVMTARCSSFRRSVAAATDTPLRLLHRHHLAPVKLA